MRVVEVRDVFVAYRGAAGSVMGLRGADLTLGTGERLLVQGPNGSGKSTLLRVITGEQPILAGTVTVWGTSLHDLSAAGRREWRARSVGFVDQFAGRGLLPELTVLQNVALQLRLTGTRRGPAERRARETCARLGIEDLLDRPVRQLSGGEAQRIAVCAAVAHQPRLVLADEPTGELDEQAATQVYELLGRVAADGTGVILVSHDPRAVAASDRAVRIRDGRAAEQWRPGSAVVEQLPDSRGWIRVPRERLPELDPVPPLEVRRTDAGLLLVPRTAPEVGFPADTAPAGATGVVVPEVLARLGGLRAAYGERVLFERLDLELRSGTWTAVTGPSGSGKSTLLAMLAGLRPPQAGSVTVAGETWADDRGRRAEQRRRWLAVLPQRPAMLDALTVRENLLLTRSVRAGAVGLSKAGPGEAGPGEAGPGEAGPGEAGPGGAGPSEAYALIEDLADRLALTRLLDQPVALLSGGERQRSALARALISAAPLLVLDEPTSQQDETSVERVVAALWQEVGRGRAVVVASHDDRVVRAASSVLDLAASAPGGRDPRAGTERPAAGRP